MELWFWAAVGGGFFAGLSNFCFKVAAKRQYNAELFTLVGGIVSVLALTIFVWIVDGEIRGYGMLAIIMFLAGMIASSGGIMKVYALRHIDTTIFFPLFKLLSPLLALFFGIVFFAESHTLIEWTGLILGLMVPLLLITRIEKSRQANLIAGLMFVVLISATSATAAAMNKWAIDLAIPVATGLWFAGAGVTVGTIGIMLIKARGKVARIFNMNDISLGLVGYSTLRALLISASLGFILYAYTDGSLGIVQTIHSMYILIPIVLAIVFYNEHWNAQKFVAVGLSIAALGLLG